MRERWSKDIVAVQCGELQLDLVHRRATLADAPMHLPPRIVDLLAFFLAAPDQLHSREAILADVWEGLVVEEGSLGQAVWLLRKALGPERRDSLQSVPKRGYVFHPWAKIAVIGSGQDAAAAPASLQPVLAQEDALDIKPQTGHVSLETTTRNPKPAPVGRAAVFGRVALASLLLIGLVAFGSIAAFRPLVSAPAHRTIALWVKPTPEGANRERELALLLEDWLQYRLAASAENLVLTAADLDEEETYTPTVTLMLSVVPVAADANQLKARVDVLGEASRVGGKRIEGVITQSALDADLQRLADEVLKSVDPRTASSAAASFSVGKARASYAEALRANKEGRFEEALQQLELALLEAPDFAPIRLRLARAQTDRGAAMIANEHYRAARAIDPGWTSESPYTYELERAHATTFAATTRVAEQYLALHKRYPQRADILLDAIEAQASPVERLRMLSESQWTGLPSVISRRATLLEGWSFLTLGRPNDAEARAASVAEAVGSSNSRGALKHLSDAKAMRAIALYNQNPDSIDFRVFEDAAEAYIRDGRTFQVLRIRAQAELLAGHRGKDPMPNLEQLLSQAERNQLRLIELNLHRSIARRLFNLNDPVAALDYLKKAERVAAVYGGHREIAWVSSILSEQYWMRGELSQAQKQLDELNVKGMDLDTRTNIAAHRAMMLSARGETEAAADVFRMQRAEIERIGGQALSAESEALLRMEEMGQLFARGDLSKLSREISDFRTVAPEHLLGYADVSEIWIKVLSGDHGGARELMLSWISEPDFNSNYALEFAEIGVVLGALSEAEALALPELEVAEARGYQKHAASAALILAQIAAARRDWARVEALIARIASASQEKTLSLTWELDFLEMLLQARSGSDANVEELASGLMQRAASACDPVRASVAAQAHESLGLGFPSFAECKDWPVSRAWRLDVFWVEAALDSI